MEEKNCKPMGNPNIGQIAEEKATGPRTMEGKLRAILKGLWLSHGRNSKIIKRLRHCNVCPLREREETVLIRGIPMKRTIPAKCPHYHKKRKYCLMPHEEYVRKLRTLEMVMKYDIKEFQKNMILQAAADAELSREIETLKDGHPKFYSKEFMDLAMKYANEILKMEQPFNNLHIHAEQDLVGEIIKKVREKQGEVIDAEQTKGSSESKKETETFESSEEEK